MKIGFVIGRFPALSETFVLNQITGLIDLGHELEVFAEERGDEGKSHSDVERYSLVDKARYRPQIPGNQLARLKAAVALLFLLPKKAWWAALTCLNPVRFGREGLSLRLFFESIPFLPSRSFDAVICHFGPSGLKTVRLRDAKILRGRIVTVFHGFDLTMIPKLHGEDVYERLFASGDLFLPISEHWKNRLIALGCDPRKIVVHRMGVDLKFFPFRPRAVPDDHSCKIVTVARLVEKKGVEFGIRAFARLLAKYRHMTYVIAGDGPLREELQQLAADLGVADKVQFWGWKSSEEIKALLDQAHMLLVPSVTAENGDQEGIPVVLMEAMALGIPVVSTYHSGIPELVESGVSGFLVAERDVDALALRMAELIESPEMCLKFARSGRDTIEAEYDIEKLNSKLDKLLSDNLP